MYKFHYSPPLTKFNLKIWGKKFKGKKKKKEERKKKREKEGKKKRRKKKRERKEEEKKRKRKEKERGKKKKDERKKKEGKKKVEIGEETLLKFAGVPLSKFLKINRYLKPEVRDFPRGEGGSFVDGKNW